MVRGTLGEQAKEEMGRWTRAETMKGKWKNDRGKMCVGLWEKMKIEWKHQREYKTVRVGKEDMDTFREFVRNSELVDIGYVGSPFTWSNRRGGENTIRMRLDRVLSDVAWCLQFPKAACYHLPATRADHCPIILDTEAQMTRGHHRFVFYNRWVGKEECEDVIREAWRREVKWSQWFKVVGKIHNVRMALIERCKNHNFNSRVRIEDI
ncbi:hypothetical protein LIER_16870 [Lithospermum erythrorhizon]|uniref:Reverse transcriptase n=1 Tax=Lithospermum erythrorhizon TaxID=34254 RepID=A0AAV3Q9M7_LITER